jgi:hypothetical protein
MAANGAPDLLSGAAPASPQQLATSSAAAAGSAQGTSQWGIFLNGAKVLSPDSIAGLDYRREWRLADFPLEEGAFESYDKVAMPFDVQLRVTKGGDAATRAAFLAAVEKISGTLDRYDVLTPEATYTSVSVASLAVSRNASGGNGLITVLLGLRQVRVTATQAFLEVQAPQAADSVNGGTVQPQAPTPAVAAKAATSLKKALPPAAAAGAPTN